MKRSGPAPPTGSCRAIVPICICTCSVPKTEARATAPNSFAGLAGRNLQLFELARLYCEPHAFNFASNRTLRAAGFEYVSTQGTTPAPLNVQQVTNLWVFHPST